MTQIQKLQLYNFRNFESITFDLSPGISLIIGPNGSGKTNLLEAISALVPGRGLRGALGHDMCKIGTNGWNIESILETKMGPAHLSLSYDAISKKKNLEFNDKKITLSELANFTSAVWLTPQMDGLFMGSSSDRRRFLDRLVLANFTHHAEIVSKYEKYQKERLHILETSTGDDSWLSIIERDMSSLAVNIIKNRLDTVALLNNNIKNIDSNFPKAHIILESPIIEHLENIEAIGDKFKTFRSQDRDTGRTNFGANKTDFVTYYGPENENIPAHYCSTGQQKSLLISILMAHQTAMEKKETGRPLLLLDEIFVHLDDEKRQSLADFLLASKAQIFITTTENNIQLLLKNPNIIDSSRFSNNI